MKHSQLTIALVLAGIPSLAFAQAQDDATRRGGVTTQEDSEKRMAPKYASVSSLIGKNVWSAADPADESDRDDMADIRDLVIDSKSGKVKSVILSSGGIGNVGDKLRQVDFAELRFTHEGEGKDKECKVSMDTTEKAFDARPVIEQDTLDHYGTKAIVQASKGSQIRAREAGTGEATGKAREAQARLTESILGSELDDLDVRAAAGSVDGDGKATEANDLGDIDELWVDLATGEVAYATFEHDGRTLVFPYSALALHVDLDGEKICAVAPTSTAALASAPAIDENAKQTLDNDEFRRSIDAFYKGRRDARGQ